MRLADAALRHAGRQDTPGHGKEWKTRRVGSAGAALAAWACLYFGAPLAFAQKSAVTSSPAPESIGSSSPDTVTSSVGKQPHGSSSSARHEAERKYLEGAKAVEHNDLHGADDAFAKAAALNPANKDYAVAEQIARTNLVTQLLQQSDKAKLLGRADEANAKLLEASTLDANNPSVLQHEEDLVHYAVTDPADNNGVQLGGSIALQPTKERHSFHIRGSGQTILQQVLTAYGLTPTIDPSVQVNHTSFDGDDLSYAQAAHLLQLATNSFFVALDPKRVLVAKDTKENRDRFQRLILETIYLPGVTTSEMTDVGNMARTLFDAQQTTPQANGTLTVRAPEARLAALNRTIADLLDGRSQVDLEVRLIEIDTSRTTNIGVALPQEFTAFNVEGEVQKIIGSNSSLVQEIVANGLAPAGDLEAIVAVLIASGEVTSPLLSEAFGVFGNGLTLTGVTIPGATANFALNSSDTRMLEDVHIRLQDKDAGTLIIGEKYPIETSSYSGLTGSSTSIPGISTAGLSSELAALGLSSSAATQNIPQVQYQDIGLNLKVTPHMLRSQDVALDVELKLSALAGTTLNSIPELTNRQFTASLTAKDGRTTAFLSDLTKQETGAVSGIPGLSELPGFGSTTDDTRQLSKSTLLILITPRVIRREHTELAGPAVMLPHHD